ncbi:hypothetical protein [Streptomyces sp. NPDC031705]|uniref:hypothetical protein n=1 Tax=Streptomyces sp. NPDC031705 TaxID=3155729 RepID=UPI0034064983
MSTPQTGYVGVYADHADAAYTEVKSIVTSAFMEVLSSSETAPGAGYFIIDARQPRNGSAASSLLPTTGTARVVLHGDADDRERVVSLLESSLGCTKEETYRDDETVLHIDLTQAT